MHKKKLLLFSIFLSTCIAFSAPLSALATPATTEESLEEQSNLLSISTVDDFLSFAESCRLDSYSKNLNVVLEADLDLSQTEFECIPIFYGTFNGNNHRIKGFTLNDDGSTKGLFRYIGTDALIKNLIVEGTLTPDGSRNNIGGIAGENSGHIENCVFSGTVTGAENIGGLVGINTISGIIENCQIYGTLHGDHFVGGIAGNNYGVIRDCSNLAKINTTVEENNVEISDITLDSMTTSESAVTATDIGGIAGTNSGVIRNCQNQGSVGYQHIGYNIGGICGNSIGYITGCTNYSTILGRKEVGGIVGQMEPATVLDYNTDTFQILESQLNTMSALTEKAGTNAETNATVSDSNLNSLSKDIDTAQKALEQLESADGTTDPDQILASQSALAGSLSNILETSGKIANENQHTTDALSKDLNAITNQAGKISSTLSHASDNLGVTFTDISASDTENDTIGKVSDCTNSGSIQADLNVGGIVGTISIETDLDPEEDIVTDGNTSMNMDYNVRAVIRNCQNQGLIIAKRQFAGGIVGLASLGLVHSCTNTGELDATGADHIGGIAGESNGYIRHCYVKCILSAASYVGGIAGTASQVSDCRSMIQINDYKEKYGAILGYAAKEYTYENNYYLPVKTDLGGIDGISYEAFAKPLLQEDFFALENLPDMFKKQTLRFVYESGSSKNIVLDYGTRIEIGDIPSVPKKSGYRGTWKNYDELISSKLVFDTTFTTIYTPLSTTIQSRDMRNEISPVLLAEGEFTTNNTIKLTAATGPNHLAANQTLIEAWSYNVPKSNSAVTFHYLPPSDSDTDNLSIYVQNAENSWNKVDSHLLGNYLVFPISEDDIAFAAIYQKPDYTMYYVIAGGAIALFVIIFCIIKVRKKKK